MGTIYPVLIKIPNPKGKDKILYDGPFILQKVLSAHEVVICNRKFAMNNVKKFLCNMSTHETCCQCKEGECVCVSPSLGATIAGTSGASNAGSHGATIVGTPSAPVSASTATAVSNSD